MKQKIDYVGELSNLLRRLDGETVGKTTQVLDKIGSIVKVLNSCGGNRRWTGLRHIQRAHEILTMHVSVLEHGLFHWKQVPKRWWPELDQIHQPKPITSALTHEEPPPEFYEEPPPDIYDTGPAHPEPVLTEDTVPVSAAADGLLRKAMLQRCRDEVQDVAQAIDRGDPPSRIADLWSKLSAPVEVRATRNEIVLSAGKWHTQAKTGRHQIAYSSGFPHLDAALSELCPHCGGAGCQPCDNTGYDVIGFLKPGQVVGVVAASGHGKSSFTRGLLPALAEDLRNWGTPEGKVLVAITEEEPDLVAKVAGLHPGGRKSHLADQVLIARIGSSRKNLAVALYDTVRDAEKQARRQGTPIESYLPHVALVDYVQAITESGENQWVEGITRTSELLLRGFAGFNPEELAKFGGVSYEEHTGQDWPDGLGNHRLAVLATAQVKSLSEKTLYYREGMPKEDFVLTGATGQPLWEVKPGDHRILRRGDVAGAGTYLNNVHSLMFLHRSNVHAAREQTKPGQPPTLDDCRSRILFDKNRSGISSPIVDLSFSLTEDGLRARFYDYRADAEMEILSAGQQVKRNWQWTPDMEVWRKRGDPIVPVRETQSPLKEVRYQ